MEAALNDYHGETTARQWRGIRGNVRQTLDLSAWSDKRRREDGLLTKLHGSLDWKRAGEQIHVGDAIFTGDHSKQAIIYPGFKGSSKETFFHVFHSHLAEALANCELLIFIGFAFRDDHINQIIRENVRQNTKVYVLNPDDAVAYPSNRGELVYVRSGFDLSSVKDIVAPYIA